MSRDCSCIMTSVVRVDCGGTPPSPKQGYRLDLRPSHGGSGSALSVVVTMFPWARVRQGRKEVWCCGFSSETNVCAGWGQTSLSSCMSIAMFEKYNGCLDICDKERVPRVQLVLRNIVVDMFPQLYRLSGYPGSPELP